MIIKNIVVICLVFLLSNACNANQNASYLEAFGCKWAIPQYLKNNISTEQGVKIFKREFLSKNKIDKIVFYQTYTNKQFDNFIKIVEGEKRLIVRLGTYSVFKINSQNSTINNVLFYKDEKSLMMVYFSEGDMDLGYLNSVCD